MDFYYWIIINLANYYLHELTLLFLNNLIYVEIGYI